MEDEKRNEFKEVKELYGNTSLPVVLDITAKVMLDEHYGNYGEFVGVCAEAAIIFPNNAYILFAGKIHSCGIWGIVADDEETITETIEQETAELKDMLDKMKVKHNKAKITKEQF